MGYFWEFTGLWQETNMLYADWAKRHGLSLTELLVALSLVEQPQGCPAAGHLPPLGAAQTDGEQRVETLAAAKLGVFRSGTGGPGGCVG